MSSLVSHESSGDGDSEGDPPPSPLTAPPTSPPPPPPPPPPPVPAGRGPPEPSTRRRLDAPDQSARPRRLVVPPAPSRFDPQNRLLFDHYDTVVPNLLAPSPAPASIWVTPPSRDPRFNGFFVKNSLRHLLVPCPGRLSVVRVDNGVFETSRLSFLARTSRTCW